MSDKNGNSKNTPDKEKKQSKKYEITLLIDEKNLCSAWIYQDFINKHLEEGTRLPACVFSTFFSFFENGQPKQEIVETVQEEIIVETIERFSNRHYKVSGYTTIKVDNSDPLKSNKDGTFSLISEGGSNTARKKYSHETLIRHVYSIISVKINRRWTDGECVREVYMCIENYISQHFNKANQKFYKHYKRAAIATYISRKLGMKFTHREPKNGEFFSNQELYDISKNEIEKIPVNDIQFHPKNKKKKP